MKVEFFQIPLSRYSPFLVSKPVRFSWIEERSQLEVFLKKMMKRKRTFFRENHHSYLLITQLWKFPPHIRISTIYCCCCCCWNRENKIQQKMKNLRFFFLSHRNQRDVAFGVWGMPNKSQCLAQYYSSFVEEVPQTGPAVHRYILFHIILVIHNLIFIYYI